MKQVVEAEFFGEAQNWGHGESNVSHCHRVVCNWLDYPVRYIFLISQNIIIFLYNLK